MTRFLVFYYFIAFLAIFENFTRAADNGHRANSIYDEAVKNRAKSFQYQRKSEKWKKLGEAMGCSSLNSFCHSKATQQTNKMETALKEADKLKTMSEKVRKPHGGSLKRSQSGISHSKMAPIDENVQYHSKSE